MMLDRAGALGRESAQIVRLCRELSPAEWARESRAAGWTVKDVVAHLGGAAHAIFGPASLRLLTSKDIERTNDDFVAARRSWSSARVLAEFENWSRRLTVLSGALLRTPLARLPMPLAELGKFPAGVLMTSAFVFDQHTHLRFDLVPALGRPVPPCDAECNAVVAEWMFAVLGNQLAKSRPGWLTAAVEISLHGPGGGSWRVGVDGAVRRGDVTDTAAHIEGAISEFPGWGTARLPWRECDVKVSGDTELGTALLDQMNIV